MKTKHFTLLLVTGLFLFACQKEVSQDTTSPTSPTDNDSTVLSKYIQLDTLNGRIDTITVSTFEYDNLKRLTKVITISYFNNLPDLTDDYDRLFYYYNGSDTLPYKTLDVFLDEINIRDSIINFFTRNANQVVIRDSSIDFFTGTNTIDTIAITSNYTIFADSVIENQHYHYQATLPGIQSKFKHQLVRTNNEVTKQTSSIYRVTAYEELFNSNFQFDDKFNPFRKLYINYPIALNADTEFYNLFEKNNLVNSTITSNLTQSFSQIRNYIYNNLKYPKTSVIYDPALPAETIKAIFIYTK
jgi:hypothetical protein